MRDYINLGSTPPEESCAQVGSPDYLERARIECARYIQLIRAALGPEPTGARLATKLFPHEFGGYYEVVCHFDDTLPESLEYALRAESEAPTTWNEPQ